MDLAFAVTYLAVMSVFALSIIVYVVLDIRRDMAETRALRDNRGEATN